MMRTLVVERLLAEDTVGTESTPTNIFAEIFLGATACRLKLWRI